MLVGPEPKAPGKFFAPNRFRVFPEGGSWVPITKNSSRSRGLRIGFTQIGQAKPGPCERAINGPAIVDIGIGDFGCRTLGMPADKF